MFVPGTLVNVYSSADHVPDKKDRNSTCERGRRLRHAVVSGMIAGRGVRPREYIVMLGFKEPGLATEDVCSLLKGFNVTELQDEVQAARSIRLLASHYRHLWGDMDKRLQILSYSKCEYLNNYKLQDGWKKRVASIQEATGHANCGRAHCLLQECAAALGTTGCSRINTSMLDRFAPEARARAITSAGIKYKVAAEAAMHQHPTGLTMFFELYEDFMRMECGVNVQRKE
jgi:hypothetical protein